MSPVTHPRQLLDRARSWWLNSAVPRLRRVTGTRRRTVIAGAAGLAIVVGGASVAWAGGSDPSSYRTAIASTGSIEEVLDLSGSIESANRRDVGFGVGGEVATVTVSLGDTIEAGDVLATLDTTDLEEAVEAAEERVASAEETLASDLEAQSSSDDDPSEESSDASESGGSAPTGGESSADPALDAAVIEVQTAQEQLLTLIEAAAESLTQELAGLGVGPGAARPLGRRDVLRQRREERRAQQVRVVALLLDREAQRRVLADVLEEARVARAAGVLRRALEEGEVLAPELGRPAAVGPA